MNGEKKRAVAIVFSAVTVDLWGGSIFSSIPHTEHTRSSSQNTTVWWVFYDDLRLLRHFEATPFETGSSRQKAKKPSEALLVPRVPRGFSVRHTASFWPLSPLTSKVNIKDLPVFVPFVECVEILWTRKASTWQRNPFETRGSRSIYNCVSFSNVTGAPNPKPTTLRMASPKRVLQKSASRESSVDANHVGAKNSPNTSFSDLTGALANRFTVSVVNFFILILFHPHLSLLDSSKSRTNRITKGSLIPILLQIQLSSVHSTNPLRTVLHEVHRTFIL